jgi:hypothetical protein
MGSAVAGTPLWLPATSGCPWSRTRLRDLSLNSDRGSPGRLGGWGQERGGKRVQGSGFSAQVSDIGSRRGDQVLPLSCRQIALPSRAMARELTDKGMKNPLFPLSCRQIALPSRAIAGELGDKRTRAYAKSRRSVCRKDLNFLVCNELHWVSCPNRAVFG